MVEGYADYTIGKTFNFLGVWCHKFFIKLQEQVEWAVEGGADYIIGETFNYLGEAMLALEAIKTYGKGRYHIKEKST